MARAGRVSLVTRDPSQHRRKKISFLLFVAYLTGRVSPRFLDRLLPNAVSDLTTKPPVFFTALGLPRLQVDSMAARKDLVLYSGDLLPIEARKLPSCPRSHSVGLLINTAPLVDAVRFYEASKHSSLALINSIAGYMLYHTLLALFPTLHTPPSPPSYIR